MTELQRLAVRFRIAQMKCFRQRGFGHIGGSLSITDTLAALYGRILNYNAENPKWEKRDYVVMSKGHCGPALYAALAVQGFFPEDWLLTLNEPHTRLPSHCDMNLTPGIDMTTGALGQGVSTAAGIALGLKLKQMPNKVFCIAGDGECNEGQVWEAVMFAAARKLSNFVLLVDYNKKQLDGLTDDIIPLGDMQKKFEEFGWYAVNVEGNNPDAVAEAIEQAFEKNGNAPIAIILNTKKGYGIDFVEAIELNHHINIGAAEAEQAIAQLERRQSND